MADEQKPVAYRRAADDRAAKIAQFGCIGFGAALVVGLILLLSMCAKSVSTPASSNEGNTQTESKMREEVYVVSACDLMVKSALKSESSYDPNWQWQFARVDGHASVMRKFEAINSFNAKLTSSYVCKYDDATDRIIYLAIIGDGGVQTLVDLEPDAASNGTPHHKRKHR